MGLGLVAINNRWIESIQSTFCLHNRKYLLPQLEFLLRYIDWHKNLKEAVPNRQVTVFLLDFSLTWFFPHPQNESYTFDTLTELSLVCRLTHLTHSQAIFIYSFTLSLHPSVSSCVCPSFSCFFSFTLPPLLPGVSWDRHF